MQSGKIPQKGEYKTRISRVETMILTRLEFEFYNEEFKPDQGKLGLYIYIPVKKT
jgi:predicted transcriptional regulator YdeE